MKIKSDFVLRQVADTWVAVPVRQAMVDFGGMLTLNESGALLWKGLEQNTTREALANILTGEYDVSGEEALADVDEFIAKLEKAGCIQQES